MRKVILFLLTFSLLLGTCVGCAQKDLSEHGKIDTISMTQEPLFQSYPAYEIWNEKVLVNGFFLQNELDIKGKHGMLLSFNEKNSHFVLSYQMETNRKIIIWNDNNKHPLEYEPASVSVRDSHVVNSGKTMLAKGVQNGLNYWVMRIDDQGIKEYHYFIFINGGCTENDLQLYIKLPNDAVEYNGAKDTDKQVLKIANTLLDNLDLTCIDCHNVAVE